MGNPELLSEIARAHNVAYGGVVERGPSIFEPSNVFKREEQPTLNLRGEAITQPTPKEIHDQIHGKNK